MKIEFFVPGIARPAGSKNAFKHPHTGNIIVTHACKKTKGWMDSVKWFAMKAANWMILLDEAVRLELVFVYERPKNHYGTGRNAGCLKSSAPRFYEKTTMPDLTKILRGVEDALKSVIWKDDALVVQQVTMKRYCRGDEKPGVYITIITMSEVVEPLDIQADIQLTAENKQMELLFNERKCHYVKEEFVNAK